LAISAVSVGQRIAASILNAIINIANRVDQVVVPTSVSGTGVSVTTNGKVALVATPAASINGVYSTTYQKYRVVIDGVGSAGLGFTFVLRVGGADVTTANYDDTTLVARNSAVSSATAVAGASWAVTAGSGTLHNVTIELAYPGTAQATTGVSTCASMTNPQVASTANGLAIRAWSHRLSTAYDGFTVTFSGGTFTGTIKVYGEHNN
jgi:hypothetical protein